MKKEDRPKPDEVRPPLDTKGMSFNEVLKRMAQTKPEEVEEIERQEKEKSTNPQEKRPSK